MDEGHGYADDAGAYAPTEWYTGPVIYTSVRALPTRAWKDHTHGWCYDGYTNFTLVFDGHRAGASRAFKQQCEEHIEMLQKQAR